MERWHREHPPTYRKIVNEPQDHLPDYQYGKNDNYESRDAWEKIFDPKYAAAYSRGLKALYYNQKREFVDEGSYTKISKDNPNIKFGEHIVINYCSETGASFFDYPEIWTDPHVGVCGCDTPVDSDHDGIPSCMDVCDNDPLKTSPGVCGCGVADTDTDYDGTPDCNDGCPSDPNKIAPGQSGCGVCGVADTDTDTDHDTHPDCVDACPLNPNIWNGKGLCLDCNWGMAVCSGISKCYQYCYNDPLNYPNLCAPCPTS
jgi:hypothetical protein